MTTAAAQSLEFINGYQAEDLARIAFAWNGKHANEFVDANQQFRWTVVRDCIENPSIARRELLEHLFLADAEWSRQAWGAPKHFADLGQILLQRGGCDAIDAFSVGFATSFDTFGACHGIKLSAEMLDSLLACARNKLSDASDSKSKTRLELMIELFEKILRSTAEAGWVALAPGTEVSNIRIVSPSWPRRLWGRLTGR